MAVAALLSMESRCLVNVLQLQLASHRECVQQEACIVIVKPVVQARSRVGKSVGTGVKVPLV